MSDELSNATRIAALEEQVRQLTEENERLTNDAIKELIDSAAVREFSYHHQGDNIEARAVIQSPLMGLIGGWITGDFKRTSAVNFLEQELMFTARDGDHRYTVNIRKSGGKTEAQVCGELRAELAERNAYAERLLSENVRLSNEAADVRKELEKYQDSLEVMTTDNNATFEGINAALYAADITFLDKDTYAACIGRLANERDNARKWIDGQDVRSDFPNATAMRETLESLRNSIYAACAGTGCLNAHELRQALDRERERCGVLEAEVKAWRAAEHLRKDEPHNEFMRLAEARFRTRETHALDAAKFGKEQNDG